MNILRNSLSSPFKLLIQSGFLIGLFFATTLTAQAATITANSLLTTVANDAICTLPEAITSANNNAAGTTNCTAGSGADIINFSVSGTIDISGANLTQLTSPITIDGGSNITIDANNTASRRIFDLSSAATPVAIQNITLREGNQTSGGCITTAGNISLTITNSTISNCTASSDGGAIFFGDNTNPSLILTNVSLLNNTSTGGEGGAVFGDDGTDITATNLIATGNSAPTGSGAVIYYNAYQANASNVTITGASNISNNSAPGGAISIRADDGHLISGVTFNANIGGVPAVTAGNGGAIQTLGVADITISNNTFTNNITYNFGSGGAIEIGDAANAIIENNTFTTNESDYGGAIHVAEGTVAIRKNAFLGNEAVDEGGAIYLSESGGGGPDVSIQNNTFDSNIANSDGGGAIRNRFGNAQIYNNTFTNNSTPGSGAVLLVDSGSQTVFANNIFDDNTGTGTCSVNAPVSFTNQGNNFFDSSTGCSPQGSDITAASADLGALALNSGTTLNRLPNGGSPVIDAASATYAPADDQRSVARPFGVADDIGSVENDTPADSDGPIITFTNDVAAGPVGSDTVTVTATDISGVSDLQYKLQAGAVCNAGSYGALTGTPFTTGDNIIIQTTEANNGLYVCVYAEDSLANSSYQGSANDFNIDATDPVIAEVTPVPSPTNDTTPNYTFSSTEAGTISYGGDCSSATTAGSSGNNTVTFNALAAGPHTNCTVTVTDTAGNASNILDVNDFTIDTTAPTVNSINRVSAATTNTDSVDFTVTFTENVTGVNAADFNLTTTGSSAGSVNSVSGGPMVYTVNVNLITGDGTIRLDVIDDDSILDSAGNPLGGAGAGNGNYTSGQTYTIDNTASSIAEVTPVPTPTNDTTPNYTFSSTQAGTISYGGDCSSATTAASSGNNTVTFNALAPGAHTNCTVTVTDPAGNASNILDVSDFTIDTTAPVIAEVTPVPTPTNDTTPNYTFSSTEAGTISYGGDCSSVTTAGSSGNNTVTFSALAPGAHTNCTVTVTDTAGNASNILDVSDFTIDTTAPVLAEVTPVTTPTADPTPNYTFSSTEAGNISYGGDCSSATTLASSGNNTITFNTLTDGAHTNCTIIVTDPAGNASNILDVSDFTVDANSPTLAEVTPVPSPDNDTTPSYTFSSTEAGDISYGGDCSSVTVLASIGNNTITFDALADGTYTNCTITVTDAGLNDSNILDVSDFTIDTAAPTVAEVTPVSTPTDDTTPNYTFSSTENATITYGGSCSSATNSATAGNNIIAFNTLAAGTYTNCTITVTDAAGNASNLLAVSSLTITSPSTGGGGGGGGGAGGSFGQSSSSGGGSSSSNCTTISCITDQAEQEPSSPEQPNQPEPTPAEILGCTRPANTSNFNDISSHWAKQYIENLYSNCIVDGKTSLIFAPDQQVTRAEITKMVFNNFIDKLEQTSNTSLPFTDLDQSAWYIGYLQKAFNNNLISGYMDNTFKPNAPITRAEALKIILLGAQENIINEDNIEFQDIASSAWYYNYISTAINLGIIQGYEVNGQKVFQPDSPITRAEVSKLLTLLQ
ncbi:MAG: S-layer homology domain-containing protein [Candidatus Altimarinota bacterium]